MDSVENVMHLNKDKTGTPTVWIEAT